MKREEKQALALLSFFVSACGVQGPPPEKEPECVPRDLAPGMPSSATSYAELCGRLLGQVPTADCGEGVRIPITVDGIEVFETPEDNICDNTGFKGSCDPGSTIRRQQGTALDGSPRPEVIWVTFCRSLTFEYSSSGLGSVQMIGHDIETGATCFFESPDALGSQSQNRWVSRNPGEALKGELPGPGHPEYDEAWIPPPAPCSECHHNDPFIHNPWIDGARLPEDPSQSVLPEIAGPDSPYWVVGGPDWDLRTPHIEGNPCTSCHRVGMGTVDIYESVGVIDINELMPPADPGSMPDEFAALRECWETGPDEATGCELNNPPGAYCD